MENKFLKFVVFCFVGGIATLIDFLVLNLSMYFLGNTQVMATVSKALGIIVSMLWNFPANRYLTFKANNGKIRHQLPRWLLVYIITSLVNIGVFSIIVYITGTGFYPRTFAFVCATGVSLILNFIFSLFWTFKKRI
jgi:putative flippase GtrA